MNKGRKERKDQEIWVKLFGDRICVEEGQVKPERLFRFYRIEMITFLFILSLFLFLVEICTKLSVKWTMYK